MCRHIQFHISNTYTRYITFIKIKHTIVNNTVVGMEYMVFVKKRMNLKVFTFFLLIAPLSPPIVRKKSNRLHSFRESECQNPDYNKSLRCHSFELSWKKVDWKGQRRPYRFRIVILVIDINTCVKPAHIVGIFMRNCISVTSLIQSWTQQQIQEVYLNNLPTTPFLR